MEQSFNQLRYNGRVRINGIEAISVFSHLNNWNMSHFCSLDIIHLIEGLYKSFIKLWTKGKYSSNGTPLTSSSTWQEYDRLLQKQKLTSSFGRPVRSIVTEGKYYKTCEILIWFLYLYPCLKGFVPNKNYNRFSIFCESLYELLSPRLTWKRIDELEVTLLQWVLDFQTIYGKRYVSMNVHNVSHLCYCTKVFVPLWCSTCFPFECFNKVISRSIKASEAQNILILQHMKEREADIEDAAIISALNEISGKKSKKRNTTQVTEKIYVSNLHAYSENSRRFYQSIYIGNNFYEAKLQRRQQTYSNHIAKLLDSRVIEILEIFSKEDQLLMKAMVLEDSMFQAMELIRIDQIACPVIVVRVGDMIVKYAEVFSLFETTFVDANAFY
jgi:hypothetical protein